tara:strand:+ start:1494 stop:2549 length:1056 start_codon:yes stop_codon:yes gene_type:complete
VISKDFWKEKKILVTGHTGFKGSWLTILLNQLGSNVYGISYKDEKLSLSRNIDLQKFCNSNIIDLRDYNNFKKKFDEIEPQIVIHLAAQSLVLKSYEDPYLTYSTNLIGLVNVFDAVRNNKNTKVILNVTSDKCYKNTESKSGYTEEDALGGYDPYSNSKACSELISESYRNSFFSEIDVACLTARAGNVIGGGDWSENRLVPDIFKSIVESKELEIRRPEAVRPWQHVLEPLIGYLTLIERAYENPRKYSEPWNFGPENENIKTVKNIVDEISKNVEIHKVRYEDNTNLHETTTLKLNIEKAKEKLKWVPKWGFEKTIQKTCDWYKSYISEDNIEKLTINQINEYLEENN